MSYVILKPPAPDFVSLKETVVSLTGDKGDRETRPNQELMDRALANPTRFINQLRGSDGGSTAVLSPSLLRGDKGDQRRHQVGDKSGEQSARSPSLRLFRQSCRW